MSYSDDVRELVENMVEETMNDNGNDKDAALNAINENRLDEEVSNFMISTEAMYVLNASDNAEYGPDNGLVSLESDGGFHLNTFLESLAYWATYVDAQNLIDDVMKSYIEYHFTECDRCSELVKNDDILESYDEYLCSDCYDEAIVEDKEE